MALVGYAHVSSVGQSLDVQLSKLQHCDKIYAEKKSGAVGKRSRLEACLEYVHEGDMLVVARSGPFSTLDFASVSDRCRTRTQTGQPPGARPEYQHE